MARLYLAPMEEVTGYLFRQILERHFGGVDTYFTPFLSPVTGCAFKTRQGRELAISNPTSESGAIPITICSPSFVGAIMKLVDLSMYALDDKSATILYGTQCESALVCVVV